MNEKLYNVVEPYIDDETHEIELLEEDIPMRLIKMASWEVQSGFYYPKFYMVSEDTYEIVLHGGNKIKLIICSSEDTPIKHVYLFYEVKNRSKRKTRKYTDMHIRLVKSYNKMTKRKEENYIYNEFARCFYFTLKNWREIRNFRNNYRDVINLLENYIKTNK